MIIERLTDDIFIKQCKQDNRVLTWLLFWSNLDKIMEILLNPVPRIRRVRISQTSVWRLGRAS
jgi:hypothetical protein